MNIRGGSYAPYTAFSINVKSYLPNYGEYTVNDFYFPKGIGGLYVVDGADNWISGTWYVDKTYNASTGVLQAKCTNSTGHANRSGIAAIEGVPVFAKIK